MMYSPTEQARKGVPSELLQSRRADTEDEETDTVWACLPRMVDAWRDHAVTGANGMGAVLKGELCLAFNDVHDVERVRVVHLRCCGRIVVRPVRCVINHHQPEDPRWQLHVHVVRQCRESCGGRTLRCAVVNGITHAGNARNGSGRHVDVRHDT